MAKVTVAVIIGSLRKDSINLKLGKALAKLGQDKFEAKFLSIGDLPLFNQDLEANFPETATRLKNDIVAADAVLFVTPEYNRSMPGPLKNAIDWCSRPYGKNAFAGKPAAICGASPGAIGTACAQSSLKPILSYLDIALMGQPEMYLHFTDGLIDGEGNITNDNTKKFLQKFVDSFANWIAQHASNSKAKVA
ncbi:MAG: NAD(P)H-dependent oxidoreductase [Proteobacteria bacterium]|nr:NAD(P)H-dependent oxidoreductase [Pseudomonadota bacterium]